MLDEILRNRVVCSIANSRLQQRLLVEPNLTLKKAVELAQTQVMANQEAQHLQQKQPQSGQMNKLMTKPQSLPQHSQTACHICKGTNHFAVECRFKNAICQNCNKREHIARACLSTAQAPR